MTGDIQAQNRTRIILYVGGFELPDKNAAAHRVLANAKIFADLGYHVVLLGVDKSLDENSHVREAKTTVFGFDAWNVPYPKSKLQWLKRLVSIVDIKQVVAYYGEKNIYAMIGYNYPAIALFRLQKYATKIRSLCIADTTEWYGSSGGGILFNTIKWLDTSLRMRFVQPRVSGVITPSIYLTSYYEEKGCTVVELPTLYDTKELQGEKVSVRLSGSAPVRFLYAGSAFDINRVNKDRTNIKDRLDKVIEMFAALAKENRQFVLDIYGLSKENYLSVFDEHRELLSQMEELIVFHGRQPHQDIIKYIKASNFTVFIRDIDRVIEAGFPSKFAESISCGTPVVCNMISNIEKHVKQGHNCMIVDKDDVGQQVKALKLLTDQKNIQDMKKYCSAHPTFDYRYFINPVEHFFREMKER